MCDFGLAAHAACLWFTNDYYNLCCAGHCVLLYCTVLMVLPVAGHSNIVFILSLNCLLLVS